MTARATITPKGPALPQGLAADRPDDSLRGSLADLLDTLAMTRRELAHARQQARRQADRVEALHHQLRQARGTIQHLNRRCQRRLVDNKQLPLDLGSIR